MTDSTDFSSLTLTEALLGNLASLGYAQMTPIQAAALPLLLQGKDVIGQAKTGSGKTAAFGLSLLQRLDPGVLEVQALVICPTRELADQVGREVRALSRTTHNVKLLTLCGGASMRAHRESLSHGAHIVVGTPGRLRALLEKGALSLARVATLVLDEADRMLEMGFEDDVSAVLSHVPPDRQTLLFSATYPPAIEEISRRYQRDPLRVSVDTQVDATLLRQHFYKTAAHPESRAQAVTSLLFEYRPGSTLVFCNTRQECNTLAQALNDAGILTLALHGELEQRDRDEVLSAFVNGSCSVLVATDVAARGLDIEELHCVINYELSRDPSVHVHRVGRTGRAGHQGLALSLCAPHDMERLRRIAEVLGSEIKLMEVPRLDSKREFPAPEMATLRIEGGRRDKLRPGDILGALTGEGGIAGDEVGKIQVMEVRTYVAVKRAVQRRAFECLSKGRIKKHKYRVSRVTLG